MEIRSLEGVSLGTLADTFNKAFEGYFVKLHFTAEQLRDKMISERSNISLSVGTFDNGELVGFILNGIDILHGIKTAYNGGTGVVPAYRGHNLTGKMYEYILPLLAQENVKRSVLEVISNNIPAIKTYEKAGFKIIRNLPAFKRTEKFTSSIHLNINKQESADPELFKTFRDWEPAWQRTDTAIALQGDKMTVFTAGDKSNVTGYGIVDTATGRIAQLAVKKEYRRQGIGTQLIHAMDEASQAPLIMINVDGNAGDTINFLEHMGFTNFINSFEMELVFS